MLKLVARVALAIAQKDNSRILDGSEDGTRLWLISCEHYAGLAVVALDAVVSHGLGEGPQPRKLH
ncbi:hypothetical protein [Mesorhizobium sp. CAU 1741]|uniref:hypothetical protein n=1 Tax=Mesorhizobium sp. CAU 1741 TaxID=3140366 RepID=UPI00325BAE40